VYYYVYIIESISNPNQTYIGYTANLRNRLLKHNEGGSLHTSKYRPWRIKTAIMFNDKGKAIAFEKYLKNHSGRAFVSKHF
jgi:putative endonuclease